MEMLVAIFKLLHSALVLRLLVLRFFAFTPLGNFVPHLNLRAVIFVLLLGVVCSTNTVFLVGIYLIYTFFTYDHSFRDTKRGVKQVQCVLRAFKGAIK